MQLKDVLISLGWAIGYAECRRYIAANAITVNGTLAYSDKQEINKGDHITLGKKEATWMIN